MINNVVLTGRLTKDPDLRYINNGTPVATFNLAVQRGFKNQEGEREADFINCVIWRKAAETLANFTQKGTLIGVEGRIQTRNYENQQGQRVYVTEVNVEQFSFLESKTEQSQQNNQQQTYPEDVNPMNNTKDPFAVGSSQIEIDDDSLPF